MAGIVAAETSWQVLNLPLLWWSTMKQFRINPKNESPAEYHERFMAAILEGLKDIEEERLLENEEITRILDEEFGSLKEA
ncbi:MAG: hypothetical protein ABIS20_10345 [Thermoanaerobaculia bacterium]